MYRKECRFSDIYTSVAYRAYWQNKLFIISSFKFLMKKILLFEFRVSYSFYGQYTTKPTI